jgi:hypothetical protein
MIEVTRATPNKNRNHPKQGFTNIAALGLVLIVAQPVL